jgi:hypothetical protein
VSDEFHSLDAREKAALEAIIRRSSLACHGHKRQLNARKNRGPANSQGRRSQSDLLARENCVESLGISTKMPYVLLIELGPKRVDLIGGSAMARRAFFKNGTSGWHVDP